MKKETNIKVIIANVTADEQWYTFDYRIEVNGKLKEKGQINDDYSNGNTPKQQIKDLENGEALNLAIIRVFG